MQTELEPLGIRVVSFSPGYVRTGFFDDFPKQFRLPDDAQYPDAVADSFVSMLEEPASSGLIRRAVGKVKRRLFTQA